MRLNQAQTEYLDNELRRVTRSLFNQYYEEKDRIRPQRPEEVGLSTDQIEAAKTRQLAKDLIDARSDVFIRVFRDDLKLFPDDEDYNRFITDSRVIVVEGTMTLYEEACSSIFANPAHEIVVEAIRTSLPMELLNIFSHGYEPVTSFFLKEHARNQGQEKVKKSRTVSEIETDFLFALWELSGRKVNVEVENNKICESLGFDESDYEIALSRLSKTGWIYFTFNTSILMADGLAEIEKRTSEIDTHDSSSKPWSLEAKIGLIAVVVAVLIPLIVFVLTLAIPESRNWICGKTGYLCSATPSN